jgi:GntR family transcriptional regulator
MPSPQAVLRVDTSSGVPAYRQIADQLRMFIMEGLLAPGDALPPLRRLALDLGLHFNTVAESYRALAAEELVEITRGHGARVMDRTAPRPGPEVADNFRQKLRELIATVRARGLSTRRILAELKIAVNTLETP